MDEKFLVICKDFDVAIDSFGFPVLFGAFHNSNGTYQELEYQIDIAFLMRFMDVFNAQKLQDVNGRYCLVVLNKQELISKIMPLPNHEGKIFNIEEWKRWVAKTKYIKSAKELRNGS